MKVSFKTLVVLVGFLVTPTIVNAASCERIWGGGTPEQIEALNKVLAVEDGTRYSTYRFGRLLKAHLLKTCATRFGYMTTNTSPIGLAGWVLRNNGHLKNGVEVPVNLPAKWVNEQIAGPGFGLFMPTSPMTTAAKGEVISIASLRAEMEALKGEFDELSNRPASDEMVNDIIDRLTALGKLTPQGSTPDSVIGELESMANTIRGGFVAYQNGELSPSMVDAITEEVKSQIAVLEEAGRARDKKIEAHTKQLKDLKDADLVKRVGALESASSSSAVSSPSTESSPSSWKEWQSIAVFVIGGLVVGFGVREFFSARKQRGVNKKAQDSVSEVNKKADQTNADVAELRERTEANEAILNGGGTEEDPDLVSRLARLEERADAADETHKKDVKNRQEWYRGVKKELHDPKTGLPATHAIAKEALAVATSADVILDQNNPSVEDLKDGKDQGVCWKAECDGKHYQINIWREADTPDGQVRTDLVRDIVSQEQASPIAIKKLVSRVKVAVASGRAKLIES